MDFCELNISENGNDSLISSVTQDNPSDKDINLVVFNLDASVSNEEVRQIFGHYGEVKEVCTF